MKKINNILLILSILFGIAGVVFIILFVTKTVSGTSYIYIDTPQLRYLTLFLRLSVASCSSAVFLIIAFMIAKAKFTEKAFFFVSLVISAAIFCGISAPAVNAAINDYSEHSIYTDIQKESDEPEAVYLKYFPYFNEIKKKTDAAPYFSLNEYSIENSTLKSSQIYNSGAGEYNIIITTDYFETDKAYLINKYTAEKGSIELYDEELNELPAGTIKKREFKGYNCYVTTLKTEKRFKIQEDNYYFTLTVTDDHNVLGIDEAAFLELGISQFELLRNEEIPFNSSSQMN